MQIVAATIYARSGAYQFDRGLRSRRPRLHRLMGRVLVACGFAIAVMGVWMAVATDIPTDLQGPMLPWVRIAVAIGMFASLVLGLVAIRTGRALDHQAWMARAYALALGAGTQAVLLLPPTIAFGDITGLARDLGLSAAWLVNLLVVECALRRRTRIASPVPGSPSLRATAGSRPAGSR